MIRRALTGVLLLGLLAACAPPPGPPIAIRPGIGQAANLDVIRPPSGANYRYRMESDGVPVPVELSLTSKRRSATRYDYAGTLMMTLPDADNLEELSAIITETLELEDAQIRARGNKLLIPVGLRTDNRFRSVASNLLLVSSSYTPHDCFAVIGTCRYTAREGNRSIALIAETTEKDGIWRTRTRPDPRKSRSGRGGGVQSLIYSIDKNAVLIDMVLTSTQDGQRSAVVFRRM